ncbi:hypothetical protein D0T51_08620 [Parabacteroides sp. 52]|uniref:DUF6057 family protein n=1 Tax=unclassified Parabacteroides TaxID=2649774 RepID=UPI0013D7AA65|nr:MULTISPECIES: DUF6057 family protein [unclassified Parabacteroides]MDH6534780.1 hypothetical protein [Parabacteroides sp. PM5-20]NDV55785.1 hypothetical protein [Parabacteroides sp. 52]
MKYRISVFAFLLFVFLFAFLEWIYKYHFAFIEQNQMFLFTGYYFREMVVHPGGLAHYIAEFLVQFFVRPYGGSFINAILLTATGILTALICKRISPSKPLYILYVLPVISLLCMHFDFNYLYQGTVAFLLMLGAFYLYISLRALNMRLLMGALSVFLLFWWAGPVALLYALSALLWEGINRNPKAYLAAILPVESLVLAFVSVYFSEIGTFRFAFLPDMYYHNGLVPGKHIYFSWISLFLVLVISKLFHNSKPISVKKEIVHSVAQLLLIVVIGWLFIAEYIDVKSARLKRFDYCARFEQWDPLIEMSKGPLSNYLYMNYLNLALAQKGRLADDLFLYDQRGIDGLFLPWNRTLQPSIMLSDIHFAIGNSAIAQEMAFESSVSTPGYGNPRLFKRLIQTNLIYGAYPVAEKYLDILEKTLYYRSWAKKHRDFLYNDEKVEKDPLLGEKRRCLIDTNFIVNHTSASTDLLLIAAQNPGHKTAIEYFGCAALLTKDMNQFKNLIETYYGTDILPTLPRSFQEAVIILYEGQPEMWEHYKIPEEMIRRFQEYKKQVLAHRNNSGAANLLRRSFGDTCWFYFMFK